MRVRLTMMTGTLPEDGPQVVIFETMGAYDIPEPVDMTAARFGVSESTVYGIRSGRTWRR